MTNKPTESGPTPSISPEQILRELAEEQLAALPAPPESLSPEDALRVFHEMQVYQIELEMQNKELRRTQRELEMSRSRYFDLYDLAPVGYFTISEQGLILEANLTAVKLLGVVRSNLVRQPFSRFIHSQDKDNYYQHRKQLLATGEPQVCELRLIRKDVVPIWVRYESSTVQNAVGATVCLAVVTDITERRQAEEVLRTREQQFQVMFENHDAVMLLINPETGAIIDANSAAARFYGYDFATLISKNINDINALDPNEIKTVCSRALHGERNTFIFPHRLAGGETRMVEVNTSPITHKGQTILFSIIHDITDRIRAEEQLRKTLAELSRSNEELQQFAYVASHDLREPLRMVVSYTELLAKRYGNQLDDAANKFIAYAVEGATRLQRLIDDLLAFSRVGTKRQPQESAPTGELLDAAVHNLQAAIEESGAVITYDALPTVRGDHSQLIQLFQNLVGNAIKFRRPGEPPHIHVTACNLGQEWQFSVADNGIGIDPQFNERIFVIFQRLHAREQYPGTGIGLAICKRIVERHGGRIWVESMPGEGTTFHFTLGYHPPAPS